MQCLGEWEGQAECKQDESNVLCYWMAIHLRNNELIVHRIHTVSVQQIGWVAI